MSSQEIKKEKLDYISVHKYTKNNKNYIEKSKMCGCFYCLSIFEKEKVVEYLPGNTAICPYCPVDSVICDSLIDINEELLKKMNEYWFERDF